MTSTDESASYEIINIPPNPSGQDGEILEINGEKYYHWIFYAEDPTKNKNLPKHVQKKEKKPFRFREEIEQERYEWFCGGWTYGRNRNELRCGLPHPPVDRGSFYSLG